MSNRSLSGRDRWLFTAGWAALLLLGGLWIMRTLAIDSDLRLFLPDPETPEERILLEELEEGPGTRLLLVALSGLPADQLAAASDRIATELRQSSLFVRVENGTLQSDAMLEEQVLHYRYLLSPRSGGCACDADVLRDELAMRLIELGSPAGAIAQELLLRDPSGEVQAILESWLPVIEPQLRDGVWFSKDGRALLLLQTAAPGFDADQQRAALAMLQQAVGAADTSDMLISVVTGAGAFTVLLEQAVRRDVALLGTLAGLGAVLFLLWVLRSPRHTLLGVLTLATTGLVALIGVTLLHPSVHGITLAFGFTLLGVAMDYPVHYTLHLERGSSTHFTLHHVWPTLRLSVLTTCIAYLALALTGFTGLTQLGTFAVCGLFAAGLVLRFVLPNLAASDEARALPAWLATVEQLPRWKSLPAIALIAASAGLLWSPQPLWNNDLAGLTPVPQELQDLDVELRREFGAPDLRYVIAIRASDREAVLRRSEALHSELDRLVSEQVIGGYDSPSRLLPSVYRQRQIQQQLPMEPQLRASLQEALSTLPFREDAFEGFFRDVEASRTLEPLTPGDLAGTALAERLDAVLLQRENDALALVTVSDVRDAAALQVWAMEQGGDVLLLDLAGTAERLVERYRHQALVALAVALIVITAMLLSQLRWMTAFAVVLPVLATLAATVAILNVTGVTLTLFHIVSLILVGGLSLDYGLFFNRKEPTTSAALRTRYSVLVCWLSTTGAFALLTLSSMPVLRAIGSTVAVGVTLGFLFAFLARSGTTEVNSGT